MTDRSVTDTVRRRWAEILEVTRVEDADDFFLSGGHSLLAVRLTTALREDLGVRIPVSAIFQTRSLQRYAARLSDLVQAGG